ncbi:MAG: FAD-binding oxidoreductase, partial [Nocardioidaceae bacterium]
MGETRAWTAQHQAAVERLRTSYAAIPVTRRVRLAKSTSNLFRPRSSTDSVGLDVSDLDGVIAVDAASRTADVQGMCTYEHLVETTLRHGLMPLVVPQLKTITVGGAVSGLGIESSSFRNGLPHESVTELDVLTGDGRLVTATADNEASDLFAAFPNSYGSLGYATRLRIELEPVRELVALHHVRFRDLDALTDALRHICTDREWQGQPVDFVDGVMFSLDEAYLTLAHWADRLADAGSTAPSDYTGAQIFYRSIRERDGDVLSVHDYLWRWDTDWFWCSGAFGAQHPVVRRVWPARWRRSDVYHRLIGLEHRWQIARRIEKVRGKGPQERVVQDVEIPVEETADFLRWFGGEVKMSPVWLCPLKLREPGCPGSARQ